MSRELLLPYSRQPNLGIHGRNPMALELAIDQKHPTSKIDICRQRRRSLRERS